MPELIVDELIAEDFTAISNTVLRLDGAVSKYFPFESARRVNNDPPQPGDVFPISAAADPDLSVSCLAIYTPGAPATLEIDTGNIFKTKDAGGGAPAFSGKTGRVNLSMNAALQFFRKLDGGLTNAEAFRNTLAPAGIDVLKAELGRVAGEGVWPTALQTLGDGLAGPFAWVAGETALDDGVDVHDTSTPGLKLVRQGSKIARSYRNKAIANGAFFLMFDAAAPAREWLVTFSSADRAHRGAAIIRGHASDPYVDVIGPEFGALVFELSGTGVGIRNNSGGSVEITWTPIIIA